MKCEDVFSHVTEKKPGPKPHYFPDFFKFIFCVFFVSIFDLPLDWETSSWTICGLLQFHLLENHLQATSPTLGLLFSFFQRLSTLFGYLWSGNFRIEFLNEDSRPPYQNRNIRDDQPAGLSWGASAADLLYRSQNPNIGALRNGLFLFIYTLPASVLSDYASLLSRRVSAMVM